MAGWSVATGIPATAMWGYSGYPLKKNVWAAVAGGQKHCNREPSIVMVSLHTPISTATLAGPGPRGWVVGRHRHRVFRASGRVFRASAGRVVVSAPQYVVRPSPSRGPSIVMVSLHIAVRILLVSGAGTPPFSAPTVGTVGTVGSFDRGVHVAYCVLLYCVPLYCVRV